MPWRVGSRGVSADGGPWIDLHSHAGRRFPAGLPAGRPMVASLGAAWVTGAVRAARAAGITTLMLATVSDFAVLRADPQARLHAHRDFRPGEAYAGHRRQLGRSAGPWPRSARSWRPQRPAWTGPPATGLPWCCRGCGGGDFLGGDLRWLEEARSAGVIVLTLVHYRPSQIGDVQTEPPAHGGLSRSGPDVVAGCKPAGHSGRLRARQSRYHHGRAEGIGPASSAIPAPRTRGC